MLKRYFFLSSIITITFFRLEAQVDADFTQKIMPIQKEIISKLTGESEIKKHVKLKQRATPKERKIAAGYLSDYLTKIDWELQNHHYKTTNGNPFLDLILDPMQGINVAARLPATTNSDRYIIFGAHYDSERDSPGAIDNATGVALCLLVAKSLKQLEVRKLNFMVVLFDQEEDDEVGSRAFARELKKSGIPVHSVHTIDMVGWDSDGNRGIELEMPSEVMENLYKTAADELNIPIYSARVNSSDHKSFIDQGYNALGISEEYVNGDTTPHYHSSDDKYNTVDFEYLSNTTYLIYHVLKTLVE